MSLAKDFQHITTELISVFAVLDGLCDAPEADKKQLVRTFLESSTRVMGTLLVTGTDSTHDIQTGDEHRRLLRDHLYDLLCLIDSGVNDKDLLDGINRYTEMARAFVKRVEANNFMVQ